jgi:Fusaric acid resistance protein family
MRSKPVYRLIGTIIGAVGTAAKCANEVLARGNDESAGAARLRLAADAVETRMPACYVTNGTSWYQATTRWVVE